MIQKTIRDWGGVEFTTTEGAEQQTEWNDRTVYATDGYNSIAELGAATQAIEVKTDFITVTQAVNLDTIESDTATNNAKTSYTDAAQVATNKTNADASKVITDFLTITQAVNLDTVESDTATNNAKVTYDDAAQVATNKTNADASKIKTDFITVTGAIDLDSNVPLLDAANIFTNNGNKFLERLDIRDSGNTVSYFGIGHSTNDATIDNHIGGMFFTGVAGTGSTYSYSDDVGSLLISGNQSSSQGGNWSMPISTISNITAIGDKAITTKEWVEDAMVNSTLTGEPTGSDKVVNMVSLTQAEYNAGTPVATTFYVITDA